MRRRISTEQDRFGGYGVQPSGRTANEEAEATELRSDRFLFERTTDEPSFASENRTGFAVETEARGERYHTPEVQNTTSSVIEYSTRYSTPGRMVPVQTPAPTRKAQKRKKEDLMPVIQMPAYSQAELDDRTEEKLYEKVKPSAKVKLALFGYLAVVLLLAVAVITTGVVVGRINRTADALAGEIAAKNVLLTEQASQIHDLTDLTDPAVRDRVTEAASANGMQEITTVVEVELLPTTEPTTYKGRTNWFDKFCDFLSKIFGG